MPISGTRETFIIIAAAIGVAAAGTAQAKPAGHDQRSLLLAQNAQQQEQDAEARRKKGRKPKEERREQPPERQDRSVQRSHKRDLRGAVREEHQRARREQADAERDRQQVDQDRLERRRKQEQAEQADRQRRKIQENRDRQKADSDQRRRVKRDQAQEKQDRRKAEQEQRDRSQQRVKDLRERIKDRIERRAISREELQKRRRGRQEFTREKLKDIVRERRERREAGGRVVIEEPGERRITRDKGRVVIEHNETKRLRGATRDVRTESGPRGRTRTIITRPNGVQIISIEDRDGRLLRRIKRLPGGREILLINNEWKGRKRGRDHDRDRRGFGFSIDLPHLQIDLGRRDYYVYADEADEARIYEVLTAPPVEDLEEDYTLDEIRYSPDIRKRLRKLNLNTVNFEFGSWEVPDEQIGKLDVVARVINRIVDEDPEQIIMIAGYTDAVGSEEDNLSLSDRRAETVARILTDEFDVPPENLVTQGYGEAGLLIDTEKAEARNRRVEFMRITPYLAQSDK
jgi:outer membrane protein OmpA-like peptidoglycan-associated protein